MADERTRIPKITSMPNAEAMRGMPLTPVDGFLLSRIDGSLNETELASATGLSAQDVADSLDKLGLLGLVTIVGGAAPASPPESPGTPVPTLPTGDAPPADGIDLEPSHRHRIDALHSKLDSLTHYELLGVARTSDKKTIKRAYFELASLYHPDRFFRKNLGNYKPKMEVIFGRITTAQDVLTSKTERAEYDEYLGDVAQTREMEARIDAGASALQAAAQEAAVASIAPPPLSPKPASAPASPTSTAPPVSPSVQIAALDPQARRELLARRLLAGRPSNPPPAASVRPSSMASMAPAPPPPPPGDALRRHYEARLSGGRSAHARRHLDAGRIALAKKDSIAAVNAFKLALEFTPDDAEIARELEAATLAANGVLSETYRRQATYEEKNGQWPEASRSWTRAANILTADGHVQERAANALVQASGNLHDAAKFAQRAVVLAPNNAAYRATLGAVYLAAGLHKNAKRELEAAQQLSPQDASIAALLKRAGKG
ncbi:MAG: Tetratricopeptide repeat protein [Myxococcaceae bacterium]|nr:Tetratricopeptide repeat protein [Myxococcaceae bacterium]